MLLLVLAWAALTLLVVAGAVLAVRRLADGLLGGAAGLL